VLEGPQPGGGSRVAPAGQGPELAIGLAASVVCTTVQFTVPVFVQAASRAIDAVISNLDSRIRSRRIGFGQIIA